MPNNIPGVQATINTLPLGQPAPARGSDTFFVVGWAGWGPTNTPTLVTSWNEFVQKFGGFHANSEMATAIYLFFKNGGRRAYCVRATESSPTKATRALADSHGTPVTIATATAKYPSDADFVDIKVTVSAGSESGTKKLVFVSVKLNLTETFDNFKITFTTDEQAALNAGNSPFYDIARINNESRLITLTKNGSNAHTAPENLPANISAQALTGGDDDIADITGISTALATFTEEFGPGQVALLGLGDNDMLITHCEAFKRIGLLHVADDEDSSSIITERANYDSPYAAMYYPPLVQMRDINGSGQVKSYQPIGAIAGLFAKAEQEIGIHKAPANYRLQEVIGYDEFAYGQMTEGLRETLNERQINAIVRFPEQGIKSYGARVLRSYGRITAIHEQRTLNDIYYRLKRSLQEFVFQPANQSLFREIRSTCEQYLRELYRSGALYSANGSEDDAFRVICDDTNNPPEQLQQHRVTVDVWVHLVGMAEQIQLRINSVPLATDFDILGGEQ